MMTGKAAFFTTIADREGAEEDKKLLESIFWSNLGFEPLIQTGNKEKDKEASSVINLTRKQWMEGVKTQGAGDTTASESWKSIIEKTDFNDCKYLLLAFSSHGQEGINTKTNVREPVLNLNDGDQIFLSEILEALSDYKINPTLKDKPKIVFMISCRYFLKHVEPFQDGWPDLQHKGPLPGCPNAVDVVGVLAELVILKCKKQANVTEYEVQYCTSNDSNLWTKANCSCGSGDESNSIYLTVEGLHQDTEYCFVVRGKNGVNTNFVPLGKEHARTTGPEDEGVIIEVSGEQNSSNNATNTDQAQSDGLGKIISMLKEKMNTRKEGESVPSTSNNAGNNNSSSDLVAGPVTNVHSNRRGRFQVVSAEIKDVYSADNLPNDFLIVYGTTRGGASKRNAIAGSWILSVLQEVVLNENDKDDLNFLHILTKAASKMSEKTSVDTKHASQSGKKSMLCFSHTLTEPIMVKKRAPAGPDLGFTGLTAGGGLSLIGSKLGV